MHRMAAVGGAILLAVRRGTAEAAVVWWIATIDAADAAAHHYSANVCPIGVTIVVKPHAAAAASPAPAPTATALAASSYGRRGSVLTCKERSARLLVPLQIGLQTQLRPLQRIRGAAEELFARRGRR